ncbi:hypothetical protein ACYOEI_20075 [Singulisphaera rosea]
MKKPRTLLGVASSFSLVVAFSLMGLPGCSSEVNSMPEVKKSKDEIQKEMFGAPPKGKAKSRAKR